MQAARAWQFSGKRTKGVRAFSESWGVVGEGPALGGAAAGPGRAVSAAGARGSTVCAAWLRALPSPAPAPAMPTAAHSSPLLSVYLRLFLTAGGHTRPIHYQATHVLLFKTYLVCDCTTDVGSKGRPIVSL